MLRHETINLLEENIGSTPFDINHSNFWGDLSQGKGNYSKNKQMKPN